MKKPIEIIVEMLKEKRLFDENCDLCKAHIELQKLRSNTEQIYLKPDYNASDVLTHFHIE